MRQGSLQKKNFLRIEKDVNVNKKGYSQKSVKKGKAEAHENGKRKEIFHTIKTPDMCVAKKKEEKKNRQENYFL